MNSYTGWCHTHRFPNNLSDRVKRQLYFLAAQTRWAPLVDRLIQPESQDIADLVLQRLVHH